jgi:isopentenyl diphosphate isomerase/L-lactate dehydrogenase-like FMN-dependent dehydrogenase
VTIAALGRGGLAPRDVFETISASQTWHDLERICGESGLPLVVKGVLTAEDARLACEHGASGIVVSNHGGRQLDGVSATIDALEEVVEAADGRVEVLVDGGIRRGTDVVKALALGARAVLVGRAPLWGLAVDGEAGARRVLELLQTETLGALQLVGCTSPADVSRDRVARASK